MFIIDSINIHPDMLLITRITIDHKCRENKTQESPYRDSATLYLHFQKLHCPSPDSYLQENLKNYYSRLRFVEVMLMHD
jgi:hypothetical protein